MDQNDDKIVPIKRRVKKQKTDSGKFRRLKSMKCFPDVLDMIATGYAVSDIARFIQEDKEEYTHVEQRSLERNIKDFIKNDLPSAVLSQRVAPGQAKEALEGLNENIDVLNELTKLYRKQESRINKAIADEEEFNVMNSLLGKEVTRGVDILLKIKDVQQDFNMLPRNLGTFRHQHSMSVDSEDSVQSTFMHNPSQRNQMIDFLNMLETTDQRLLSRAFIDGIEDAVVELDDDSENED